jgi:hypothetical protein
MYRSINWCCTNDACSNWAYINVSTEP